MHELGWAPFGSTGASLLEAEKTRSLRPARSSPAIWISRGGVAACPAYHVRVASPPTSIDRQVNELVARWRKETLLTSSATEMILHPAYQRLIGLGSPAVAPILRELQREPDHLFWALVSITAEDPVASEDEGDLEAATGAWLAWGRAHGLI